MSVGSNSTSEWSDHGFDPMVRFRCPGHALGLPKPLSGTNQEPRRNEPGTTPEPAALVSGLVPGYGLQSPC